MPDHIDGTTHFWELSSFVNQRFSGTAVVSQDALVVCHACGSWKVMAQAFSNAGGVHNSLVRRTFARRPTARGLVPATLDGGDRDPTVAGRGESPAPTAEGER